MTRAAMEEARKKREAEFGPTKSANEQIQEIMERAAKERERERMRKDQGFPGMVSGQGFPGHGN
jgi:hypothetical protein